LIVMKFGGSSLSNRERMENMARLVINQTRDRRAVVLSAMGDTTDCLLAAARDAERGDFDSANQRVLDLVAGHLAAVEDAVVTERIQALEAELRDVVHGIYLLREQTPRTRALIASFGERLSVVVAAAVLRRSGADAVELDSRSIIRTSGQFEGGRVDFETTRALIQQVLTPLLDAGKVPVVTGFIARTSEGITSTLGRGGSDYSASIIAECLDAKEVWIWTDVDGILTADPRLVSEARTLEHVSYREAAEMSYFGAKVVHPKTMLPAMRKEIPIRIRSTFNADSLGTLITREAPRLPQGVKTVTSISDTALITVDGRGMSGVPGIAGRIFSAAQLVNVNVMMISQASSEQTVSLVVNGEEASRLLEALNETFALEIGAGIVDEVLCRRSVSVISIIGQGMSGTPGISGKLFQALGKVGINVLAIAQGASELSISVAIEQSQVVKAVRGVHTAFGLTRQS
jgi:aspartokinase/homoserine dehydrogenase 1